MKDSTPTSVEKLFADGKVRQYDKGQIILYDGDKPLRTYFIKTGVVKVYDIDASGSERIVTLYKAGDIFPLTNIINDVPVESFHTTVSETKIVTLETSEFLNQLCESNQLMFDLLKWYAERGKIVFDHLRSLEKPETKDKLYWALKLLAEQHAVNSKKLWKTVEFPVSQQFLADMLGVSRESVNAAIQEAQDEKIIRYPKLLCLEINLNKLLKSLN